MENKFSEWLHENYNKEELLGNIQDIRLNNCVYADRQEFEEGDWQTWDEYIDEVGGNYYGYEEVFECVITDFEETYNLKVPDCDLSTYYDIFIDFLTII